MTSTPNKAQVAVDEFREACDLIRRDLSCALTDRFISDRETVDAVSNVIPLRGYAGCRDRGEQDLNDILADHFDRPLDREWRRLMDALR
jgi:hypothetical protein